MIKKIYSEIKEKKEKGQKLSFLMFVLKQKSKQTKKNEIKKFTEKLGSKFTKHKLLYFLEIKLEINL